MLKDAGAVCVRRNKHLVFKLANGKTLTMAKTPSDRRAILNTISDLKRLEGSKI